MGHDSGTNASKLSRGVAWSFEVDAISDLTSTSAGLVAATIDTLKCMVGLDFDGRLLWRVEGAEDPVLVAKGNSLFAIMDHQIMSINPSTGAVGATRKIDPPLGGWSSATVLFLDNDLLVASAGGLLLLAGESLETKWQLALNLDRNDTIQQLAQSAPWLAAISNHSVMLVSEQGALRWQRDLPPGTRSAGTYPLIFAADRILVGLVKTLMPTTRFLYEFWLHGGESGTATTIDDLAMFCPPNVFNNVLVLDTSTGLAGFDLAHKLQRLWSIEAPVTLGACVASNGHLVASAWQGSLLRVAFADGQSEVLFELPRKTTWVAPAPNLESISHMQSVGVIDHLAVMPHGVAFSVTWSKDHAAIQFIQT